MQPVKYDVITEKSKNGFILIAFFIIQMLIISAIVRSDARDALCIYSIADLFEPN